MRRGLVFTFFALSSAVVAGQAQVPVSLAWAYGYTTAGPEPASPPCTANTKPYECSRPGRAWPEDGILLRLAGSDRAFTIAQIQDHYDPADWYPAEHPARGAFTYAAPMPAQLARAMEIGHRYAVVDPTAPDQS